MSKEKEMKLPKEILEFYMEMNQVHGKFKEQNVSLELNRSQEDSFSKQKVPLLNYIDFQPDREKVNEAFREVCDIIKRYRPQMKESLGKIQAAMDVSNSDIRPILNKYIWQDNIYLAEYTQEHGLEGELLALILFNVAKPFVTSYALALKTQVKTDLWQKNFCPVCGWKPSIAINSSGTGQKMLRCSLCETDWPFKNMKCTHCLNEDHDSLKYFNVEDDEVYRVNLCDKCKGYIKSVNEDKLITMESGFLTDLKTLYLDVLAEREGYTKDIEPLKDRDYN